MRTDVIAVQADPTLRDFADSVGQQDHVTYPVIENEQAIGTVSVTMLGRIPPAEWAITRIGDLAERNVPAITGDADLAEAYRMLAREHSQRILFVMTGHHIDGIITGADLLLSLQSREGRTKT